MLGNAREQTNANFVQQRHLRFILKSLKMLPQCYNVKWGLAAVPETADPAPQQLRFKQAVDVTKPSS